MVCKAPPHACGWSFDTCHHLAGWKAWILAHFTDEKTRQTIGIAQGRTGTEKPNLGWPFSVSPCSVSTFSRAALKGRELLKDSLCLGRGRESSRTRGEVGSESQQKGSCGGYRGPRAVLILALTGVAILNGHC